MLSRGLAVTESTIPEIRHGNFSRFPRVEIVLLLSPRALSIMPGIDFYARARRSSMCALRGELFTSWPGIGRPEIYLSTVSAR